MEDDQNVLLISQLRPEDETVGIEELHKVGTLAKVKQLVKMPKNIIRVLVEGKMQAQLDSLSVKRLIYWVKLQFSMMKNMELKNIKERKHGASICKGILETYAAQNNQISMELVHQMMSITNVSKLMNQLVVNIPLDYQGSRNIWRLKILKTVLFYCRTSAERN